MMSELTLVLALVARACDCAHEPVMTTFFSRGDAEKFGTATDQLGQIYERFCCSSNKAGGKHASSVASGRAGGKQKLE